MRGEEKNNLLLLFSAMTSMQLVAARCHLFIYAFLSLVPDLDLMYTYVRMGNK